MGMINYRAMTLDSFLIELSSRSATPGGGAAAGLVAAMGASLAAMVAALSQGPRFTSVENRMKELEARLLQSRDRCLIFADQDSIAFQHWMAAARISSCDPAAREEGLRAAMEESCRVPIALGEDVVSLQDALVALQEYGNVRVLSDVGAALALLTAALEISILTLRINQREIADLGLREELAKSIASFDRACAQMRERESQIRSRLEGELRNE
ncbi:MAG: cyclodeaminase/cyclohydrolase family protein [bacterium]